jgi:hypothetical protein
MPSARPSVPRLESRYRRDDRSIFYGRVRLYRDHLAFFEVRWTGPHRFDVPLTAITDIDWWSGHRDVNLQLDIDGQPSLHLRVEGPGLWKHEIDGLRGKQLRTQGDLPGDRPASAAA